MQVRFIETVLKTFDKRRMKQAGWYYEKMARNLRWRGVSDGRCMFVLSTPGAPMTSIFEGQSLKTMPFSTKTRVIWVPGIYIYIDI